MKKIIALITAFTLLIVGGAQQSTNAPQNQQQQPKPEPQAQQPKPQPPKPGVFTAQGKPLNFFSRGEGTLTVRGQGYLIVNTVQGSMQIEGFQEVKDLPRNVRIKPPLDQRLKVYKGQGVLRIQGKYDSVRAVLREGQINFSGVAAFNLSGSGSASVDGVKRNLSPTSAFTLLVPEPRLQQEDDVKPVTPKQNR
ncbi:MAG: hypothetical protein KatS3mg017_0692 [Fimbriimonadales bacterium]|nr:MAG: hypothetical protein KatS3mg017_0692 [Fimbriimonadales bacterium]GIV09288.1 MAG: hypothetical protein KatS3mg019_1379 [Fimbriimonadales bacterium]